jgi:hypothetical protein
VHFAKEGYSSRRGSELIASLAASVRPDLVIFTGDIIDGRPFGAAAAASSSAGKDSWREPFLALLQPLLEADPPIPWTFCPGNHDDDGSPWSRQDLLKVFRLPGCLTPDATEFNFTFTCGFLRQATAGDSIRLWVFDSGGNNKVTFLLSTSMMLLNLALVKRSQFSPGDSIRDLRLECGIRVCGAVPGLRAGNPQHRQLGLLSHPTPRIQPLHTNYRKLRPL